MHKDATTSPARSSPYSHFFAGLTTGLLTASLLQPADLLKTRLQQQAGRQPLLQTIASIIAPPTAPSRLHASSVSPPLSDAVTRKQGHRGVLALWRGTLPSVIRTGLGSALYFSGLNTLRRSMAGVPEFQLATERGSVGSGKRQEGYRLAERPGTERAGLEAKTRSSTLPQLSGAGNLLAGAGARAAAGWVLMPVTVVKVRYESSLYDYASLAAAGREIWQKEGVRGFFKGAGATAARDAPYAGLYVVVYEEGKKVLGSVATRRREGEDPQGKEQTKSMSSTKAAAVNFGASILAAGVATAATNPFDAVKTRLQLKPGRYRNLVSAAREMVKEEGWRSLMDGLGLRMGRKAMSSALAWTIYEELIRRAETSFGDAV